MRLLDRFRSLCWNCGCACCHCLNGALALLAAVLSTALFLNQLQRVIPTPETLLQPAIQKALGNDLALSWDHLTVDLAGGVFLRQASLRTRDPDLPLLEAESLWLDLSLFALLLQHDQPVEALEATNLTLFQLPQSSRSGLPEPALRLKSLALEQGRGTWLLKHLLLQWETSALFLHGQGFFAATSKAKPVPLPDRLHALRSQLLKLQPLATGVSLMGRGQWVTGPSGQQHVTGWFHSPDVFYRGARLNRLIGRLGGSITPDGPELDHLSARAELGSLPASLAQKLPSAVKPNFPVPLQLSASTQLRATPHGRLPHSLTLSLSTPFTSPLPVHLLAIDVAPAQPDRFHWRLKGPGLFASGLLADAFSAPTLSLDASLLSPSLHAFFPNLPHQRLLDQAHADAFHLRAASAPGELLHWSGSLLADGLYIGETDFSHLRASFSANATLLDFDPIHAVKTNGEAAFGSYSHHLPSSSFSLNAFGTLLPPSLDALLGRWWQSIFTHIKTQTPLHGDVAIWGQWRALQSIQSLTAVQGTGASYRGQEIPHMRVKVRSNDAWAYVEEIEARFAEGEILGSIGLELGLEDGEMRTHLLDFKSSGPWEAVVRASGLDILREVETEGNPRVTLTGTIRHGPKGAAQGDRVTLPDLRFTFAADGAPTRYNGLSFEGLRLEGSAGEKTVRLSPLSCIFAEGVMTGAVDITRWGSQAESETRLDLQIFDADYVRLLTEVSELMERPEGLREVLIQDVTFGRVDTDFKLHLSGKEAHSQGNGRITLRDANVSRIHLFGGLSRYLQTMGLGFSSLDLTAGSISWGLADGRLSIAEAILTGPVLSLEATGDIRLDTDFIDLEAEIFLMSGLIGRVLSPVSSSFAFNVEGPLESPSWGLQMDPLGWFRRLSGSAPKKPEL